jgi:hypothetical protein
MVSAEQDGGERVRERLRLGMRLGVGARLRAGHLDPNPALDTTLLPNLTLNLSLSPMAIREPS